MKEFIEKLIGRLEEKFKYNSEQAEIYRDGSDKDAYFREKKDLYMDRANTYGQVMRIVNQLAEEYINTSIDTSSGWIACEKELPKEDKKTYIVQKTNGSIDILGFTKDAYKLSKYDFTEYKGKKKSLFYGYDSEYGYIEWECEAWMPLPAPYKEGVTENE